MDSGYYTTRTSAEEQAAKKILLRENWPLQCNDYESQLYYCTA